jgi:hypothetical protein
VQKTTTLIALFSLISTAITAQNRTSIHLISLKKGDYIYTLPTENGKDSLRFGITQSGDTFTVQYFNQYQQLMYQNWHFDSLYTYDARQKVREKYYKILKRNQENERIDYNYLRADSRLVKFHSNGQIQHITLTSSEGHINGEKAFDDKGKLMYSIDNQRGAFINSYSIRRDADGKIRYTTRTIAENEEKQIKHKLVDTFFFPNGQPEEINTYKGYHYDYISSKKIYNDQGVLIESLVDSLVGRPFKDNIACLYGLKNEHGDTILPPRYERIDNLTWDGSRFAAYEGNKCVLLREDGSIILTPPMSEIRIIEENTRSYYGEKISQIPPFFHQLPRKNRSLHDIMPYFSYVYDYKTGIIDRNGKEILPPQYFPRLSIVTDNSLGSRNVNDHIIGDLKYIHFSDAGHHGAQRMGYFDLKGVSIFNPPLNFATYSGFKDYFMVSNRYNQGLLTAENKEILPFDFTYIQPILFTSLFITSKSMTSRENNIMYDVIPHDLSALKTQYDHKKGLFDAETKRWILDTIYAEIEPITISPEAKTVKGWGLVYIKTPQYFIYYNHSTKKKGLIDAKGKVILVPDKDDIQLTENKTADLFYYHKNGKYSLLNPQKPKHKYAKNYTFLKPFYMLTNYAYDEKDICFVARNHKGKWGVISNDEEIMMPFDYDYSAIGEYIIDNSSRKFIILIKNGKATYLHENYFVSTTKQKEATEAESTQLFDNYRLLDDSKKSFFVKNDGSVLIPPQYKLLNQEENYVLVEDDKGQKQMILTATGQVIAYSEDNKMRYFKGDNPLIMFKNEVKKTESMHRTWQKDVFIYSRNTGKPLTPNANYAIAIGDKNHPIFFAKYDTPSIANRFINYNFRICQDTLTFEDNDWLMYDSSGNLLNKTPFRFPIDFKNGLGVGMQGDKMGIFKSNGTPILPPQYERVWRDDLTGFYYIYELRGLKSFISVVDSNGKKCINAAQYDGISLFLGKYALIERGDKIGIIDTAGNEIISPQDLKIYKGSIIDSLRTGLDSNKIYNIKNDIREQRSIYPHFLGTTMSYVEDDYKNVSLNYSSQLSNLLLETFNPHFITNEWRQKLNRVPHASKMNDKAFGLNDCNMVSALNFSDIHATNTSVSFKKMARSLTFVNYVFKKDHWELLNNRLFFTFDEAKRTDLYNLLVKKVRQLKNADIDCVNSNALIEQAHTQFLITADGINVYLNGKEMHHDKTIISLLWSELKGLTMEGD